MKKFRPLTDKEKEIITALIDGSDPKWAYLKEDLSDAKVSEMDDGGMGSLLFECKHNRGRGGRDITVIGNAEFQDGDGTIVSLGLNLDQYNELYEFDVWKVDYSPLINFPEVSDLKFANGHESN